MSSVNETQKKCLFYAKLLIRKRKKNPWNCIKARDFYAHQMTETHGVNQRPSRVPREPSYSSRHCSWEIQHPQINSSNRANVSLYQVQIGLLFIFSFKKKKNKNHCFVPLVEGLTYFPISFDREKGKPMNLTSYVMACSLKQPDR